MNICDIEYYLPERIISNNSLQEIHPDWRLDEVQKRSGVFSRHRAHLEETALDMAVKTCHQLFEKKPILKQKIDGIIFCTQTPDYKLPGNSGILQSRLELERPVYAVDINLACSGFVYGLSIAKGLIFSGQLKNIILVTSETYSKIISNNDRSASLLFGDGCAVSWLSGDEKGGKICEIECGSVGKGFETFYVPAGGARTPSSSETRVEKVDDSGNIRSAENIHMNGAKILAFASTVVVNHIRTFLKNSSLKIEDIDLVVCHQASKMALETLKRKLKINDSKMVIDIEDIGNTVSASIPIALARAVKSQRICAGDKVLVSGFGAGLSFGSGIIQY